VTTFDSFTIILQEEFADLRAYWRFEEGEGYETADWSDYPNVGTISGASWAPAWERGTALEFDGVDDYVTVPNSPSLIDPGEGISLVAWVKTPGGGDQSHTIVEKWFYDEASVYGIDDRSFRLLVNPDGTIQFDLSSDGSSDSTVSLVSADTINLSGWSHVAATCNGDTMKVYIDGIQDPNFSLFSERIHPSGADVHIGRLRATDAFGENWHDPFEGTIDEVRIYSLALSPSQIVEDATSWQVWADCEGADLALSWSLVPAADSVFVFRDTTYFEPDLAGYTDRVASVSASDSVYYDSYGIGDLLYNAFYRLVAHSNTFANIRHSTLLGEFDRELP
jgi:hypothetical protein